MQNFRQTFETLQTVLQNDMFAPACNYTIFLVIVMLSANVCVHIYLLIRPTSLITHVCVRSYNYYNKTCNDN